MCNIYSHITQKRKNTCQNHQEFTINTFDLHLTYFSFLPHDHCLLLSHPNIQRHLTHSLNSKNAVVFCLRMNRSPPKADRRSVLRNHFHYFVGDIVAVYKLHTYIPS